MFGETVVCDSIVGIILGEVFDWSKEKIKSKIQEKREENTHECYQTIMYQAVINAFDKASYRIYKNNQDRLYEAAEVFMKAWCTNGTLNNKIISKSLNIIIDKIDESIINEFSNFLEEIIKEEELRNRYLIHNMNKTNEDVNYVKAAVSEIRDEVRVLKDSYRESKSALDLYVDNKNENSNVENTIDIYSKIDDFYNKYEKKNTNNVDMRTVGGVFTDIKAKKDFWNGINFTVEQIPRDDILQGFLVDVDFNIITERTMYCSVLLDKIEQSDGAKKTLLFLMITRAIMLIT